MDMESTRRHDIFRAVVARRRPTRPYTCS